MIQVEHLTRRFGDFVAVNDVSFQIKPGEIIGLLGHNGAGKTTMMKMLTGYLYPTSGQVLIDGHELPHDAKVIQQQLGYLPEVLPVYPDMIVADYLEYVAQLRGIEPAKMGHCVAKASAHTELEPKALAPIYTLSRGYKQRVGVASAILHEPKVLILDEPTNGLDPHQTQHMRELIQKLAQNATVIVSTHIMQEVQAICSRVLLLQNGQLKVDASLQDLQQTQEVRLHVGAHSDKLKALLDTQNIEQIHLERADDRGQQFILTLPKQANIDEVIYQTAKELIEEGVKIFEIAPKRRNLEGLFEHQVEAKHG